MNDIRDMQCKIRSLKDLEEESKNILEKTVQETSLVEEETNRNIDDLKRKIENDLKELETYTNPEISATRSIKVDFKENENSYRLFLAIEFGRKNHSIKGQAGLTQYDISVIETCYGSYYPLYADGMFCDQYQNNRVNGYPGLLDTFLRHWDEIIMMAYEKLITVYQDETKVSLEKAYEKKAAAYKRNMDIKLQLLNEVE